MDKNSTSTKGQTVAYVRVSSTDQNPARQYELVGDVDRVFEDRVSGKSRAERAELGRLLAYVREGDHVRVASMDRLARSLPDLLSIVTELTDKGVAVEFLHESLTFRPGAADPYARFQLSVLGAVADLERSLIRERQAEGIALAKRSGKYRGGTPKLTAEQIESARARRAQGVPVTRIARDLKCSRQTVYSALAGAGTYADPAA